jgi:hypothetical protein
MGFIKHRLFFLAISFGFIQWGCNTPNENLPLVTYEWVRFEQLFYDNSDDSLEELQSTYPYFFPEDTPIQVWKQKQKDSLQRALFKATQTIPIEKTDQELPRLLGRYKNIFPDATLPEKMVTLISDVDYNHKIIDVDSLLLISIDVFLGEDHPLYEGIPLYIRENMRPAQILPEIAEVLSIKQLPAVKERTFLAHLIYHGKKQWLKQQLLPKTHVSEILGFTPQQLLWSIENEKEIWNYFASQEMLFSTQSDLLSRFIRPAPFSKFYLDVDQDAPGKIGQWMGLQIVSAYADRNNKSIQEIIQMPYMELYRESKYKPRR